MKWSGKLAINWENPDHFEIIWKIGIHLEKSGQFWNNLENWQSSGKIWIVLKVLRQFKRFLRIYAQKLSGRAKTFWMAMPRCHDGFWASGIYIYVLVCPFSVHVFLSFFMHILWPVRLSFLWVCLCACLCRSVYIYIYPHSSWEHITAPSHLFFPLVWLSPLSQYLFTCPLIRLFIRSLGHSLGLLERFVGRIPALHTTQVQVWE